MDLIRSCALGAGRVTLLSLFLLGAPAIMQAQVEVHADQTPLLVFAGARQNVTVHLHNSAAQPVEAELRYRLYQASALTLAPLGPVKAEKAVPLAGKQTVVETVAVELPRVRGQTTFHIGWFDGERKMGTTQLRAFPDDLLQALAALAGHAPLGLLDPEAATR